MELCKDITLENPFFVLISAKFIFVLFKYNSSVQKMYTFFLRKK